MYNATRLGRRATFIILKILNFYVPRVPRQCHLGLPHNGVVGEAGGVRVARRDLHHYIGARVSFAFPHPKPIR